MLIQGKSWQKAELIFGSGSGIHCNYGASCKVATNSLNTKRVFKSQRAVSEKKDDTAKTTIGMDNAAYSQCEQKVL